MLLLDTSVVISLALGAPISTSTRDAIKAAVLAEGLWVSAVSAWELGLLATQTGRTGPRLGNARDFFEAIVARARLRVIPFTHEFALEAIYLPEPFHRDPSDRMLVATARLAELTFVTSDHHILAYAALGHVKAIRA